MGELWITGFEPFTDAPHNPSAAVLPSLPRQLAGRTLRTRVLPVEGRGIQEALAEVWRAGPAAVLHLGVAVDRSVVTLETTAVNQLDYRIPDNQGLLLRGAPITPMGPARRLSRLPTERILGAWRAGFVPHALSDSAGTFLCNQALYLSLEALAPETPTGFIHLPPDETLSARTGRPGLPLALSTEAVLLAALAVAEALR